MLYTLYTSSANAVKSMVAAVYITKNSVVHSCTQLYTLRAQRAINVSPLNGLKSQKRAQKNRADRSVLSH